MFLNLDMVFDGENIVISNTKNGKFIESKETVFCDVKDKINDDGFINRLQHYINKPTLMNNLNASYICLDMNLDKINFDNVSFNDSYSNDEISSELKNNITNFIITQNKEISQKINLNENFSGQLPQLGGSNYFGKYLKYKNKYINKKLKNKKY